jgi:hypothetical protein
VDSLSLTSKTVLNPFLRSLAKLAVMWWTGSINIKIFDSENLIVGMEFGSFGELNEMKLDARLYMLHHHAIILFFHGQRWKIDWFRLFDSLHRDGKQSIIA